MVVRDTYRRHGRKPSPYVQEGIAHPAGDCPCRVFYVHCYNLCQPQYCAVFLDCYFSVKHILQAQIQALTMFNQPQNPCVVYEGIKHLNHTQLKLGLTNGVFFIRFFFELAQYCYLVYFMKLLLSLTKSYNKYSIWIQFVNLTCHIKSVEESTLVLTTLFEGKLLFILSYYCTEYSLKIPYLNMTCCCYYSHISIITPC
ncbi:MAG: hypothetical protein M3Z01_08725 [Thermoproteota archaeon]|nr:hypothetical protein [Thermoproteota archaeon]